MRPSIPFRLLLLASLTLVSFPLAAQQADPPTAVGRGVRGTVRTETIYRIGRVEADPAAPEIPVMTERIRYDGRGRAIEHLEVRGDSATLASYDYDPSGRLAASRVLPAIVVGDLVSLPSLGEPGSGIVRYDHRLDRSGRDVERLERGADGHLVRRIVRAYDAAGRPTADSIFDPVDLREIRSHLIAPEGGGVITGFIAAARTAPQLASMEEIGTDGLVERRMTFLSDRSVDIRYANGGPVSSVEVEGDRRVELCYEYENDRRGNWIRRWTWRHLVDQSGERWELAGREARLIEYR